MPKKLNDQTHLDPYNPLPLPLACGAEAIFDHNSTSFSFVCTTCHAVVGSVSMPKECKEAMDAERMWETLQE